MVTFKASVDEREGNEKFSFAGITKIFRFSTKDENSADKKAPQKKKFDLKRIFRRKKKEPDVKFNSGYGE